MVAGSVFRPTDDPEARGAPARSRLRVLVVEDDRTLRDSLVLVLGGADFEVRALPDGRGFDDAVADFRPDLAVLDVDLGVGAPSGLVLARRLRDTSDIPFMFLTAADGLDDRLNGFELGADDYVTKPFSISELHARIRAVLRRSAAARSGEVTHSVMEYADVRVEEDGRTASRDGSPLELTRREFDLLVAFVESPERVLSRTQLLSMVWGFEDYDPNVVEVYVSSLRRKLEEHGPRLIQTVRGVGYVLRA